MKTKKPAGGAPSRAGITAGLPRGDLKGRVAVVVGGGRGIGRAFAVSLGAAGAAVAVVARSVDQIAGTEAEITGAGGRAAAIAVDVTNDSAVARMAKRVEGELGPVDLLVNSAGMGPPYGPFREIDPEEWWRCVEVNLRGPLLCSRAFLPGMAARKRGRIINVASGAGTLAIPNLSAYAVGKAALIRFTEILAVESREHGVAVFAIEPGTIRTEMTEAALKSAESRRSLPWLERIFKEGRDASPDGAVELVRLLASGQADDLTGRFITAGDDVEEMLRRVKEIERGHLYSLRLRTLP